MGHISLYISTYFDVRTYCFVVRSINAPWLVYINVIFYSSRSPESYYSVDLGSTMAPCNSRLKQVAPLFQQE